jgi:ribose 5-phosphate isomerase A
MSDDLKQMAAEKALDYVTNGMVIGIGSGSTADHFTRALGRAVAGGLRIVGVPTSENTAKLAGECGIPLTSLDANPTLDLTIDGADELNEELMLIKGGGGALLREKIVASSSAQMIVIADQSKRVEFLGQYPLPIEIIPFGAAATIAKINHVADQWGLSGPLALRTTGEGTTFVTDGGHWIVDASFGRILAPKELASQLVAIAGVVEHGLFIGIASHAIIGTQNGLDILSVNADA